MSRAIIVVDTETTGLDPRQHDLCEVGWVTLAGLGAGHFIPPHTTRGADPTALRINRYFERLHAYPVDLDYSATTTLHIALRGNVLAGCNPRFDAAFLTGLFLEAGLAPEPWHHHFLDLSVYAAAVLGIEPEQLPSLRAVAEALDLSPNDDVAHTAYGDAQLTATCIAECRARSLKQRPVSATTMMAGAR